MKRIYTPIALLLVVSMVIPLSNVQVTEASPANVLKTVMYKYEPQTLNPFLAKPPRDWQVLGLIYETLLFVLPNGTQLPWLAEKWDISEEGNTITFYLSKDAKWSDGMPLTAEDVKFTLDTIKAQQSPMSGRIKAVESVEVIDPQTVTLRLSQPYAAIMPNLAGTVIVPKHIWTNIQEPMKYVNEDPIGSGPMKLKEWKLGDFVHLIANKEYWKQEVLVDEIIMRAPMEPDVAVMALRQGEIHAIPEVAYTSVPALLGKPEITVFTGLALHNLFQAFNFRVYPLNMKTVRHAIDLAVDRVAIAHDAYSGYAVPGRSGYLMPDMKYWSNPDVEWQGLGMTENERFEKANEMLDQLDFKRGSDGVRVTPNGTRLDFRLITSTRPDMIRASEIVKEGCENIGIRIDVLAVEYGTLVDYAYSGKKYAEWDMYQMSPYYFAPDPESLIVEEFIWMNDPWYNADASDYRNTMLSDILRQSQVQMDPAKRRDLLFQAQEILADDLPILVLAHSNLVQAYRTDMFVGWNPDQAVRYFGSCPGIITLLNILSLRPVVSEPPEVKTTTEVITTTTEKKEVITTTVMEKGEVTTTTVEKKVPEEVVVTTTKEVVKETPKEVYVEVTPPWLYPIVALAAIVVVVGGVLYMRSRARARIVGIEFRQYQS